MELIRNLAYEDVGTVGGIPDGIIEQEEIVRRNDLNYTVKTDISYVDDPFNGAGADTDYKRVRIEASWEGLAASRKNPIILISDVAIGTLVDVEGGGLVIQVFDASGDPVPQAEVTIVANGIDPPVNLTVLTNSDGRVVRPGATPCIECYQITVTKEDYSTDRTYSTGEVANPLKPHVSVFQDNVTQVSFAIDRETTLNITSRDSRENNFASLGNVTFRLRGNKIIGTDTLAQPVYKYDQILVSDASGNKSLTNMEWDVYQVLMPAVTSYDISGTSPVLPLNLSPGSSLDFTFSVTSHTDNSFFLTVKNPSQTLIASASAHLTGPGGFDQIKTTGESGNPDFGQVLFSLSQDTYNLTATAAGFLDYNSSFDISGYTKADVILTPE